MSSANFISPDEAVIDGQTGEVFSQYQPPDQIAVLAKAEIDQQISTAKAYPRSEDKSLKKAESLACRDEDTAGSMFYSIPRGGKHIQGPSIRLAEIMAATWGNLRVQTRTVDSNDKFVTVQAVAHDLENNTAVLVEKRRRVLAKKGRAADEDSIQIAGLAGQSIVFRDAIFKIVPRVYVDQIYRKAQLTSVGKAESIVKMRDKMVAHFSKMGVGVDRVLAAVAAKGIEDIDMDKLIILRGMATSLRDGQSTIEESFPDPAATKNGNAGAAEALKQKVAEKPAETQKAEAKPETKQVDPAQETKPADQAPSAEIKEPEKAPEIKQSEGEAPEWVLNWEKRIEMMPKFSPATDTLDALLKEYRGAAEDQKGLYFDLFDTWLVKTIPFANKPSLVPLLTQKLDQVKPYIPQDVYEKLAAKIVRSEK